MKPTDLTITSATVGTRVLLAAAAIAMVAANCGSGRDSLIISGGGSGAEDAQPDVAAGGQNSRQTGGKGGDDHAGGAGGENAGGDAGTGGIVSSGGTGGTGGAAATGGSGGTGGTSGTGGIAGSGGAGGTGGAAATGGSGGTGGTAGAGGTGGCLNTYGGECDPVTPCGCGPDKVCIVTNSQTPSTKCVLKDSQKTQPGHPCLNSGECASGMCIKTVTCEDTEWTSCLYTLCNEQDCTSNKGTCAKYCNATNDTVRNSCETGIDGSSSGKCLKVKKYEKYLIGLCTHQCEPWNPKKTCADDVVSCDVPWGNNNVSSKKLIEGISVCNVHEGNVEENEQCTLHSDCPNETGCFMAGVEPKSPQCRHWCTDNNNCTDGTNLTCKHEFNIKINDKNVGRCGH